MAEITGAQVSRNVSTLNLIRFRNFLNYLVAGIEAYGWSTFGAGLTAIIFALWAIAMVFVRSYLSEIKSKALRQGDFELSNRASSMILLSVIITFLSIYAAYSEEMEKSEAVRVAASAPVKLAFANLVSLREELSSLQSTVMDGSLLIDSQKKWELMEKKRAELQNKQEHFWEKIHPNTLKYGDILNQDTLQPKQSPWGGGLLRTASRDVLAELKSQQDHIMDLETQQKQIAPIIQKAKRIEDLHKQIAQAEKHLLEIQTKTGINANEVQTLHPLFYKLSGMIKGYISPDFFMNLWGVAAILLLLKSITIISEGIIIMPNPPSQSHGLSNDSSNQGGIIEKIINFMPKMGKTPSPNPTTTAATTAAVAYDDQAMPIVDTVSMGMGVVSVYDDENSSGYKDTKPDFGFVPPTPPTQNKKVRIHKQKYNTVIKLIREGVSPQEIASQKIASLKTIQRYISISQGETA